MAPTSSDLDLSQAQAFALDAHDWLELIGTVESSLQASLDLLRSTADASELHRALHDLKGYLGLIAVPDLCSSVRDAHEAAMTGQLAQCQAHLIVVMPRLEALLVAVRTYRTGIIAG